MKHYLSIINLIFLSFLTNFSLNAQSNWSPIFNKGTSGVEDVSFFDDNKGIVVANYQYFITENGGSTWSEPGFVDLGPLLPGAVYLNSDTILIASQNARIYQSTNGGDTFIEVARTTSGGYIYDMDIKGNFGLMCSYNGYVNYSHDRGKTWTLNTTPLTGATLYHIDIVNDNVAIVCGAYGVAYRTTDGGLTWTGIFREENNSALFDFVNENEGYMIVIDTIFKTTNGGVDWNFVSKQNFTKANALYAEDYGENDILYITSKPDNTSKIYKSIDGGINFTLDYETNIQNRKFHEFHRCGNSLYLSSDQGDTSNRVLCLHNIFSTNISENTASPYKIFPNPCDQTMYINGLTVGESYTLSIYSSQGVKINQQTITEGIVNINNLYPGMYFIHIKDKQGKTKVEKVIKLKPSF